MRNDETKSLCLALTRADAEDVVIEALQRAGYWTNTVAGGYHGDSESNCSTIFNQASRSDPMRVEEIVNAADTQPIDECLAKGADSEGLNAPRSMKDALRQFFGTRSGVEQRPRQQRTRAAQQITLAATRYEPRQGDPCFTTADAGEGKTAGPMPATFLSLARDKGTPYPVQGELAQCVQTPKDRAFTRPFLARSSAVSFIVDLNVVQRARDGVKASYLMVPSHSWSRD